MEALIFNVQRFSLHDGPGIRTTVFFKGCNLRCLWCHNPESLDTAPSLQFFAQKCVGCGACFRACRCHKMRGDRHVIDRDACLRCGACAQGCFAEALVLTGRRRDAQDLLREVLRDRDFYEESDGGVTCSGGEPLLQMEFVAEFLRLCRENGLHTAVDTAGCVPWERFEKVLPHTDLFLYDLKAMDEETHRRWTGMPNAPALGNLVRLSRAGARIEIRVPVVPGVNDTEGNMRAMAELLAGLAGIQRIELLPFHRLAQSKYASLDRPYAVADVEPPPRERMECLASFLDGLPVHIA